MARGSVAFVVLITTLLVGLVPVAGGASRDSGPPGRYVVMLKGGVDPALHARRKGLTVEHTYRQIFTGYSVQLSVDQIESLSQDALVRSVEASRGFELVGAGTTLAAAAAVKQPPQVPSVSVRRVGALESRTAKIDGIDERVDADIAILDTGIQPDHPDLNVIGGTNCAEGQPSHWKDKDIGHGTGVAGLTAALDNKIGRVGIAPGARLWAIRVSDSSGKIEDDQLLCGLEWLVASGVDVEVANLSLSGVSTDPIRDCDTDPTDWDSLQSGICAVIEAGVTIVAAAGNDGYDASNEVPAAYPDVIAVSAFAETDGLPGGLGPSSGEVGCFVDIADDAFAFFSNFGPVVDLSAPGVCVGTTSTGSGYSGGTGTSFSTPIVAGATALYLAKHPDATPETVKEALIKQREAGPIAGDPDGIDEGIVNVSKL